MRRPLRTLAASLLTLASLAAPASAAPDAVALLQAAQREQGDSELFQRYPDRPFTFANGRTYQMPFLVPEAEWLAVFGTVDLAALEERLEGEGASAVRMRMPDGAAYGVAMVIMNRYPRSNAGPYDELVVAFSVTTEEDPVELRYKNPVSLTVPIGDPRCLVFPHHLILDKQLPIDVGRDVWGFPKFLGTMTFEAGAPLRGRQTEDRFGLTHTAGDVLGGPLVEVRLDIDTTMSSTMRSLRWTSSAFGAKRAAGLALAPYLQFQYLTPRALRRTRSTSFVAGIPTATPFRQDFTMRFNTAHPVGATMTQMGFTARTVQYSRRQQMVILADDPRCYQ